MRTLMISSTEDRSMVRRLGGRTSNFSNDSVT